LILDQAGIAPHGGEGNAAPPAFDMGEGLHHIIDRPAHKTEYLPKAHRVGIDLATAGSLIGGIDWRPFGETAHRQIDLAEAPGADTKPAEIFHRLTDMGAFPVERRPPAFGP